MPYSRSRLQWRALAVLGALLLVILIWPLCCAAKPTPATLPTPAITNASSKSRTTPNAPTETPAIAFVSTPPPNGSSNLKSSFLDLVREPTTAQPSPPRGTAQLEETLRNASTPINNNFEPVTAKPDKMFSENVNDVNIIANSINTNYQLQSLNLVHDSDAILSNISSIINVNKTKKMNKGQGRSDSDPPPIAESPSDKVLSRTERSAPAENATLKLRKARTRTNSSHLDRNERSANLSHITGTARKIQIYLKNRYLQLLPDGTVNGTHDDLSDYTILQRTTVDIGQIKIQGVATCLFLCMDTCGTVYGSKDFTEDCIFNEVMEEHHYNTYSSTYHSNARRTLYLALNRHGQTRKIQIPATRGLGKLATYTKALTETVPHERVEKVIEKIYGSNYLKHSLSQLCEAVKSMRQDAGNANTLTPTASSLTMPMNIRVSKQKAKCLMNKTKKKKEKRKCREDEAESELCIKSNVGLSLVNNPNPMLNSNSNSNSYNNINLSNNNSINGTKINRRKQLNGNKNVTKCLALDEECVKKKTNRMKNSNTNNHNHHHNHNQNHNTNDLTTSNNNNNNNSVNINNNHMNHSNNRTVNGLKKNRRLTNSNNSGGKKVRTTTTTSTTTTMAPTLVSRLATKDVDADGDDVNLSTDSIDDDEWDTVPSMTFVDEEDEELDARK